MSIRKQKYELDIAFEDHNLLIVNKEPNIECINEKGPSLFHLVSEYLSDQYQKDHGVAPLLCHRLDTRTGGLLIFAKNELAYECVLDSFATRRIQKYYFTCAVGDVTPEKANLSAFLVKDARNAHVKIYDTKRKGALPIFTQYSRLKHENGLSLLSVKLITGRTHQIRAHLAHIGYPILGDDKYGNRSANRKYKIKYQVLYANKIKLNFHPDDMLHYLDGTVIEAKEMKYLPSVVKEML